MRNFLGSVLDVIVEHTDRKPEKIKPTDRLADMSCDDFDWEEFFMLLEGEFQIKINDEEEERIKNMSVDDLNLFIDTKMATGTINGRKRA